MNNKPGAAEMIEGSFLLMQNLFRQVGPRIVERAGKSGFIDKHDGSPVTETDTEVEEIIKAEFKKKFPKLPVFGEETGYDEDRLPPLCWIVDPIDGTKSFIENIPTYTSMAVLMQNNQAIAAIIYNPSTGDMYTAKKHAGAFKNDTPLNLVPLPMPKNVLCKREFIEGLNNLLKPDGVTGKAAPVGSGYGFTMALDGLTAARFQLHGRGYVHDYAPGALLVNEAGGDIVPVLDDTYTYKTRSFVACHPGLTSAVRRNIAALRQLEISSGSSLR